MATPIRYPDTVGFRAGFQSCIVKFVVPSTGGVHEFVGFKEGKMSRKRERGAVYGANADQIGKTRGKNTYEASLVVYVAEFKQFVLDVFGPGYGDVQFTFEVTITENGYDTQTHYARGCTIDETEFSFSEGTDALTKSLSFSPTKVLFGGVDDNARPLTAQPAIG